MANKDIKTLRADLPRINKEIKDRISDIMRWTALRLFTGIISGEPHHPVDTGYSRANWNVSIGKPNEDHFEKSKGATYGPPAPPAIPKGNLAPIFLTNSVNYVKWLEEGTSTQAPHGFIHIQLEQTRDELAAAGVKTST